MPSAARLRLAAQLLAAALPLSTHAAEAVPAGPLVVSVARLHHGTGETCAPCEVLVVDGTVKALGSSVDAPAGSERWSHPLGELTPWLVDPVVRVPLVPGEGGRPESALLLASDAAPLRDAWLEDVHGRGVGAVSLVPSGGAGIQGIAATMSTRPDGRARILAPRSALAHALPEDVAGSAARAAARRAFGLLLEDTSAARTKRAEAAKPKSRREAGTRVARDAVSGPLPASSRPRPEPTPADDALLEVADKKLPLLVSLSRSADALAMLELARQREIRVVLAGCRDCSALADELGRSQALVVLDPLHEPAWERYGLTPDADLVRALGAAGVRVSVSGGGRWPEGPQALRAAAATLAGAGLPPERAIAAMTGVAAEAAGVADVFRLAVGRPARFLVWSGDPLDPRSRILRSVEPLQDPEPPAAREPEPGDDRARLGR